MEGSMVTTRAQSKQQALEYALSRADANRVAAGL